MRAFVNQLWLTLFLLSPYTFASTVNCININTDLTLINTLADTGEYRHQNMADSETRFDYHPTRSFEEYLTFARNNIYQQNPKAKLKCPIETGVTKLANKAKNNLVVADLVSPFELTAANNKQAILLIHGLTDSPYLFHDLATFFHSQGITVRTLLLPGHGTAPEALTQTEFQEWQQATTFAINRTVEDFESVYLGGFSTGGALVLDHLLSTQSATEKIKGILLWAPASKAKSSVAWAAQIVDWLPFLDYAHKGADIDFAKYESFPLNAGAQVYALMTELEEKLSNDIAIPDIPFLTITTEVDSTIDTTATLKMIRQWHQGKDRKSASQDTLFYFGEPSTLASLPDSINRVIPNCENEGYCKQIINVAHTSVTNSPSNDHYGWQGSYRNCETSFGTEHYQTCKLTQKVILGETTGKNLTQYPQLQRLTFNPSFEQMTNTIESFLLKTR